MTAATQVASPKLFFLKQFLRHPRMVGSIIPTSDWAIRALLDPVDWRGVRCVVEYGPGTGVFTREILRRIGPAARLIAIDTNASFIDHLRKSIPDERLICVEGSAADIEIVLARHDFTAADHIVSGLPFSTLPPTAAGAIVDATARALMSGGAFLVYQYSQFVLPLLERRFERVETGLVRRCIPPAKLFWAWKGEVQLSSAVVAESLAAE